MAQIVRTQTFGGGRLIYSLVITSFGGRKRNKSKANISKLYGIEIYSSLFGTDEQYEFRDITPSFEYAEELFEMACVFMITPLQFPNIIESFLEEKSIFPKN
ncbi:MAG: hypothetical protein GX896_10565 [Clostridiales bacterium]|nr:hypothetical protein [Clostridiales bacterium]